jgi:hypothetical protein
MIHSTIDQIHSYSFADIISIKILLSAVLCSIFPCNNPAARFASITSKHNSQRYCARLLNLSKLDQFS